MKKADNPEGATMQLDSGAIPWAGLIPILVLMVGFAAFCCYDIARHDVKHLPKWAWVIICFVSIPLGGIIYLIVGRDSGAQ